MGNSLEFNLHRLQFIQFLIQNQRDAAIQYARQNFSDFAYIQLKGNIHIYSCSKSFKEIQKLMGSLLYIGKLENSPYSKFLSPNLWNDVTYDFTSSYCQLLGLANESPLYTRYIKVSH